VQAPTLNLDEGRVNKEREKCTLLVPSPLPQGQQSSQNNQLDDVRTITQFFVYPVTYVYLRSYSALQLSLNQRITVSTKRSSSNATSNANAKEQCQKCQEVIYDPEPEADCGFNESIDAFI